MSQIEEADQHMGTELLQVGRGGIIGECRAVYDIKGKVGKVESRLGCLTGGQISGES